MTDLEKLADAFAAAAGGLPNYKREATWEYVRALRMEIRKGEERLDELADYAAAREKKYDERERELQQARHRAEVAEQRVETAKWRAGREAE